MGDSVVVWLENQVVRTGENRVKHSTRNSGTTSCSAIYFNDCELNHTSFGEENFSSSVRKKEVRVSDNDLLNNLNNQNKWKKHSDKHLAVLPFDIIIIIIIIIISSFVKILYYINFLFFISTFYLSTYIPITFLCIIILIL